MERRTVLRTLAGGIAGTVVSSNAPVSGHTPHDSHEQSSVPAQGVASQAVRRFLDDHQRETLASVADMLKYGLALILIFVGLKMVWLNQAVEGGFPIVWSLLVIGALLEGSVAASWIWPAGTAHRRRVGEVE